MRSIITIAVLWILSLLMVGTVARGQGYGVTPLPEPKVLSGPDVGVRIEGDRNGTPVGRFVVRMNGRWIPAEISSSNPQVVPAR